MNENICQKFYREDQYKDILFKKKGKLDQSRLFLSYNLFAFQNPKQPEQL